MDKYQDSSQNPKKISQPAPKPAEKPENEVDKFLKSMGLEKYSKIMNENGIDDLEILQELNETHLEELGIVLGHRLKILKKIKEMNEPQKNEEKTIIKNMSPLRKQEFPSQEPKSIIKNMSPLRKQEFSSQESLLLNKKSSENALKPFVNKNSFESYDKTSSISPNYASEEFSNEKTGVELKKTDSKDLKTVHEKDQKAPLYPNKKTTLLQSENIINKSPIASFSKVPIGSKPMTVGKSIATYQPNSSEAEKTIKLSEIIETKETRQATEEIKWDAFGFTPYKPSDEIQASISNKAGSRPHSAKAKIEKPNKNNNEEKFEVIGWDN